MVAAHASLRALKQATRELHVRAEHFVRILDEDASVVDYARYLIAMRGFHAPIEDGFAADRALAGAGFDSGSRKKSQWITQDLLNLARDPQWSASASGAQALCASATLRCSALPAAGSLARQLGIAYVLEGSTLGGKYILAHLPPSLRGLRGRATAFLDGYGGDTGARWREFCSIAAHVLADDAPCAEAIDAARDTFACLIAWLARFEPADHRRGVMQEAS